MKLRDLYNRLRYAKYRAAVGIQQYRDDPEGHGRLSFSQEGEDRILAELLGNMKTGFYVDIGALHPIRCSNSYLFYLAGWRGINIDATPGSMKLFNQLRPRDINVECAIAEDDRELEFFIMDEPAMSTFDPELARHFTTNLKHKIVDRVRLRTRPLEQILDEVCPQNTQITFMDVDVEGFDLQVLKSNNWKKYRPGLILAEDFSPGIEALMRALLYSFLSHHGYHLRCRGPRTCIFQRDDFSDIVPI